MELFVPFSRLVPAFTIALMVMMMPVYGQISSPCTASMISSFTPCINFITNSTSNGSSPTSGCCSALKSLTSTGTSCLCLIVNGNVPFQLPINRTLALSLPRACNMPGVPLQCNATGAPLPAPGPIALGPTPGAASPPIPSASPVPGSISPSLAPESDTTPALTPPTVNSGTPTSSTGSRPVLTPSAAKPSYSISPSLLLIASGILVMKYF
ncbi:hypothetical protein L1049_016227 [Liquidambar formosana]|uniref:Bifunctional inhibitor/plant lipid transfer protein/seed storage helical domain-containing protein n=1 Tax=Liquidambar formosana TaxID=63359 RepID=A0AAP0RZF1_LIQFO